MKKIFSAVALIMFLCVSAGYAAPQCTIVSSSIPWDQGDQGTWVSDTYQLTIECKDNGAPVEGYQAKFDITLQEGANWENSIATLTTYSTPTNSSGVAQINVPLIHQQKNDGKYIHICPFDDINCNGGVQSNNLVAIKPAQSMISIGEPRKVVTPCSNTNTLTGCCETTITITCCTPNRVFTYCTTVPQGSCATGTTNPDPCTTIFTQYAPGGICDYCTGKCDLTTLISLSSFNAKASNGRVKLEWVTESEIDNAGFNIYRAEAEDGVYTQINDELIPAKGSEIKGAKYLFTDNIAKNRKTYFYKLEDIDIYGVSTFHGPVSATPRLLNLFQ